MYRAISLVLMITACWSHAQTGFVTSFGGNGVQDGIGAVATAQGYLVVSRSHESPSGRPGITLFQRTENGQASAEIELPLSGAVFPQAVASDLAGGCFIAGSIIAPGMHEHDGLLIHLGPNGTVLWTSVPPVNGDELYLSVTGLPDGGAVVCGVVGTGTGHDGHMARFSGSGALLWSFSSAFPLDDELLGITATTNALVATGRQMNPGGTSDLLVIHVDPEAGSLTWSNSVGGPLNETGNAVVSTSDGTSIVAGTTNSYGPLSPSGTSLEHLFLVAFDQAGDTVWTAVHGDPLRNRTSGGMVLSPDGDLFVAGQRYMTGSSDAMVLRFTPLGELVWERVFDLGVQEQLKGITALPDGFVSTGGCLQDIGRQVLLLRRDANGF